MQDINTRIILPKDKPIVIGESNWFAFGCKILKGTETPPNTVVASCSLLNKQYVSPEYSLLAGVPAKVVKTGIKRLS